MPRPLYPRGDLVPNVWEAGWAPGMVRMGAENLTPHRDLIPRPSSTLRDAVPTTLTKPVFSILSVTQGSVMAVIKELDFCKVCTCGGATNADK
jgi:hypothetical protein